MRQDSQFGRLYQERVIQLRGGQASTDRRWEIWSLQQQIGFDPCFGTDIRYACERSGCPWREECQSLCADWKR